MKKTRVAPPKQIKHFIPQIIDGEQSYSKFLQGKATNALAHISKRGVSPDPITGAGSITVEGVSIFLKNYNSIALNIPTHKVLDALTIKLSSNFPYGKEVTAEAIDRHRGVDISVKEYMDLCQLKDRKEARRQLKEAVLTLYDVSLEWDEIRYHTPDGKKKRKKETLHWKARIIDTAGADIGQDPVQRGKVSIKFTYDIAKYLSQSFIMPYPDKLLSIDAKHNPHSYYMGRKLAEHHNMNIGKGNANRIAVKTLLECLPDLPSYETVMSGNSRSVTQKIIQPFERDLIALQDTYGILSSWHYCNKNGEPLTDEQVESYSYDSWVQWLIEFELTSYPDQSDRLAAIASRKNTAKKRARKGQRDSGGVERKEDTGTQ